LVIDDKVIFVHVPRTSGTSIRRALLWGEDPNEPHNLLEVGDLKKGLFWGNQKHAYASMIKENIDPDVWNSRLKFSVVRNPWDRMVSMYGLFRKRHKGDKIKARKFLLSFRKIPNLNSSSKLDHFIDHMMRLNFDDWIYHCIEFGWNTCMYLDEERSMVEIPQCRWHEGVDKVFRFEDRQTINDFLVGMGYHPTVVENQSTSRRDWRTYYNETTYDLVAELFQEDIELYRYGE
jgi:hypothetical protein